MASPHTEQRKKQVRRFVVLYLGVERDNHINTYLEQLPAKHRSEFIRQALYTAIQNAPRQLRLPELGHPGYPEPELSPAGSPDPNKDWDENALIANIVKHPNNDHRNRLLTQFTQGDLEAGEDLMGLVKDLLWQHYTGEQVGTPDQQSQSQDAKRQAVLSAKLKKMSFAALIQ